MPKMEIEVSNETMDVIKRIWKANQVRMSEEVLHQLDWTKLETFAGDLLSLGFEIASEDPRKFILHMREQKAPIFKEPGPMQEAKRERAVDDSLKAYA